MSFITTTMMGEMPHADLKALIEWVQFNNLLVGDPERGLPYFAVRQADDSGLTAEQSLAIEAVASREIYEHRVRTLGGALIQPLARELFFCELFS